MTMLLIPVLKNQTRNRNHKHNFLQSRTLFYLMMIGIFTLNILVSCLEFNERIDEMMELDYRPLKVVYSDDQYFVGVMGQKETYNNDKFDNSDTQENSDNYNNYDNYDNSSSKIIKIYNGFTMEQLHTIRAIQSTKIINFQFSPNSQKLIIGINQGVIIYSRKGNLFNLDKYDYIYSEISGDSLECSINCDLIIFSDYQHGKVQIFKRVGLLFQESYQSQYQSQSQQSQKRNSIIQEVSNNADNNNPVSSSISKPQSSSENFQRFHSIEIQYNISAIALNLQNKDIVIAGVNNDNNNNQVKNGENMEKSGSQYTLRSYFFDDNYASYRNITGGNEDLTFSLIFHQNCKVLYAARQEFTQGYIITLYSIPDFSIIDIVKPANFLKQKSTNSQTKSGLLFDLKGSKSIDPAWDHGLSITNNQLYLFHWFPTTGFIVWKRNSTSQKFIQQKIDTFDNMIFGESSKNSGEVITISYNMENKLHFYSLCPKSAKSRTSSKNEPFESNFHKLQQKYLEYQGIFYNRLTNLCEKCEPECKSCYFNASNCLSCYQDYILTNKNTCVQQGVNNWIIITISIGGVLILAIGIFLFCRKKKCLFFRSRKNQCVADSEISENQYDRLGRQR